MRNFTRSFIVLSCFFLLIGCKTPAPTLSVAPPPPAQLPLAWVEVGPQGKRIVRLLTRADSCPQMKVDQKLQPMSQRGKVTPEFPIRVCEATLAATAKKAQVYDQVLTVPTLNPKRILVLGDTGCVVKIAPYGTRIQECNQSELWPFANIAKEAAQWKPDLIIHVGDYFYRESACPAGNGACKDSPHGDNWATWEADFFSPGQELLKAAPWVFVRGNHELCSRGGRGWFRFLDPRTYSETCSDHTPPYFIPFKSAPVAVLDSASADDLKPTDEMIQNLRKDLKEIQNYPMQGWILTHRPFWAYMGKPDPAFQGFPPTINKTLQKASEGIFTQGPARIHAILAGHIHLFQALDFNDSLPAQFVVGMGGTKLYYPPGNVVHEKIDGREIQDAFSFMGFGYMTMEYQSQTEWSATAHDSHGKPFKTCTLKGSHVRCR